MMRCRWAVGIVFVAGALMCASAQAAPVTVGQLFPPASGCEPNLTFLQTSVASGNSYTVPVSGTITSWSFDDSSPAVAGLKLKVGRPAGGSTYTIVGESAAPLQNANSVNTMLASIPVQAGDIIGIYEASGECGTVTGNPSDTWDQSNGDVAVDSTTTFTGGGPGKFPVSVTVEQQPGISSVSPASGSIKGGTSVTISGHDFIGASSVSFGGRPAASFTVNSATQISAVAPSGAAPGAVDLSVHTGAGTTPTVAADKFTYTACVVPKLKGKNLKKAKKALKKADCKLGKVRPKGHKKGHVKKQKPKPGTVLAPGSKVSITL